MRRTERERERLTEKVAREREEREREWRESKERRGDRQTEEWMPVAVKKECEEWGKEEGTPLDLNRWI